MFQGKTLTVLLPTYNEKDSIRSVIEEFEALGIVDEIVVVNNNAAEGTSEEVAPTSAREVFEPVQGYGASVLRAYRESQSELTVLCEPDATFEVNDIFKLLEYSREFDVVYGSRTCNVLIWPGANMGYFLRFGNWAVAKMIEVLFNTVSLSDVGCTYRLVNRTGLELLLKECSTTANYFSPEMMITTLCSPLKVVQIPLNYKARIGESMGSGTFGKAFNIGINMILLVLKERWKRWFS
jgi:glycosyltransferase involved in cell wall biosynthesis